VKDELGFDDCVDHRDPAIAEKLKAACPKGIDVYFENVSGAVWDAVFPLLNPFARIPVCGLIAQYSATDSPDMKYKTSQVFRAVLTKRLTIRGFIVSDFWGRFDEFIREVPQWIKEGRIKYREDIAEGLENAPAAFMGMLKGKNFGKQLVRIAE
jgi:NADPH-dependent curcumin reductase CurA